MILHPQKQTSLHTTKDTWLVNLGNGLWKEEQLTREQLRHLAKAYEVKCGRNTDDTVAGLIKAGKIKFLR